MGSPLAPILANLFMGYHEKDWIEKAQVDDIFAVFESELDAETFHTYLNTNTKTSNLLMKNKLKSYLF